MTSWLLGNFYKKKQQILIQKTYQLINVVNGARIKQQIILFSFDYGHRSTKKLDIDWDF